MVQQSVFRSIACLLSCVSALPLWAADESGLDLADTIASRNQVEIFTLLNAGTNREIDRIESPLLRYTDPARKDSDGTLWAWGTTGRPVAVLEMFRHSQRTYWVQWFHRTSDIPLKLTSPNRPAWTPMTTDVNFQPIPNASVPGKTQAARRSQLKLLARQFTAHEFWGRDNSRSELRLLAQPAHRYQDPAKGVLDGGVFIIAHGTNPEVTLFIEAVETDGAETASWQFGVGRTTQAEYHILYDGEEVASGKRVGFRHPATNSHWGVN